MRIYWTIVRLGSRPKSISDRAGSDCCPKRSFSDRQQGPSRLQQETRPVPTPRNNKKRTLPAYALFTDPPLGRVGLSEAEALATGKQLLIGSRPMTQVGRAVEKGETLGFMKVVVDAETQNILGAAILGTEGDEAIHGILDTMYAKANYRTLQRGVHIHPTVSELIPTLLGQLKPFDPKSA
jgi:pyruvate/2-oxoglutarate dehydrogenase complex dihydrolipoamide dehydrogenase (E3) component